MKYIFLTGAVLFGVVGISQAMDAFDPASGSMILPSQIILTFQSITVSFQPLPGFLKVLLLSLLFLALYATWRKIKGLGIGKIWDYVPC